MTPSDSEREEFENWYYKQHFAPITSVESLWDVIFPLWLKLRTLEREKVELQNSASTEQYFRFETEKKNDSLTAQLTLMAEGMIIADKTIESIDGASAAPNEPEKYEIALSLAQSILEKKGEKI